MASTIRTMTLVVLDVRVEVALRGASEKKDVSLGKALPILGKSIKRGDKTITPIIGYERIRQLYVAEPAVDAERLVIDPLQREKGKVSGIQFDRDRGVVQGVWEGDDFYPIKAKEVELIEELTRVDALTIQEFVPLADVPWERAQASYFLAPPQGVGARTLATIRQAMENKGVAGVAKLMPKSRQKLCVIYPKHGGLMVTVLAYANTFEQVLEGAAAIGGATVNAKAVKMTEKLIGLLAAPVSALDEYRDDQIDLKADLIERAKMGEPLTDEKDKTDVKPKLPTAPDNLVTALTASVEAIQERKRAERAAKPKAKAKRQKAPSRETPAAKV